TRRLFAPNQLGGKESTNAHQSRRSVAELSRRLWSPRTSVLVTPAVTPNGSSTAVSDSVTTLFAIGHRASTEAHSLRATLRAGAGARRHRECDTAGGSWLWEVFRLGTGRGLAGGHHELQGSPAVHTSRHHRGCDHR